MRAQADDIGAGNETARVSAADAEARRLRQIAARRYLDGRFPQELADELADILGLTEEPVRAAGHCSCGEVLPMSSATSSPTCRPGMCAKCTAAYKPPRVMTGQCSVCRRTYGLTNSGRIRSHQGWDRHVRLAVLCEGSQRPPAGAS